MIRVVNAHAMEKLTQRVRSNGGFSADILKKNKMKARRLDCGVSEPHTFFMKFPVNFG